MMIVSETVINPTIARQILQKAKENGVTVEDFLNEIAKEKPLNGNREIPKVRRSETRLDFSRNSSLRHFSYYACKLNDP